MASVADELMVASEYPAKVPETPKWQENYAFNCTDTISGIGLLAFLGRSCADPGLWREVIAIALPDGRILCIKNYGRAASADIASASLFRVEIESPGRAVRITHDGPAFAQPRADLLNYGLQPGLAQRCTFDIVIEGVAPVWQVSGDVGGGGGEYGSLPTHIEQVGRADGYIEFGNERFELRNASAGRAHRNGARDITNFKRHCWAFGRFEKEDITFNASAVELYGTEGIAASNASVTRAGHRYPAEVKMIELIEGYADGWQPFSMLLACELGEMLLTKSVTITSTPLSMANPWDVYIGAIRGVPSGLTFAEAVHWQWGDKQGIGWSERCFVHEPFSRFSLPMRS